MNSWSNILKQLRKRTYKPIFLFTWLMTLIGLLSHPIPATHSYFVMGANSFDNQYMSGCWIPPETPQLVTPTSGTTFLLTDPWIATRRFDWTEAPSSCPSALVEYQFELYSDPEALVLIYTSPWRDTSEIMLSEDLIEEGTYYWRVKARDQFGNTSTASELWSVSMEDPAQLRIPNEIEKLTLNVLEDSNEPKLSLTKNDSHYLEIKLSNAANYDKAEYILTYWHLVNGLPVQDAVVGSLPDANQQGNQLSDIYLGTCSSQHGYCVPHMSISDLQVIVTLSDPLLGTTTLQQDKGIW